MVIKGINNQLNVNVVIIHVGHSTENGRIQDDFFFEINFPQLIKVMVILPTLCLREMKIIQEIFFLKYFWGLPFNPIVKSHFFLVTVVNSRNWSFSKTCETLLRQIQTQYGILVERRGGSLKG